MPNKPRAKLSNERRRFLKATGAGLTGTLIAGCTGGGGGDSDDDETTTQDDQDTTEADDNGDNGGGTESTSWVIGGSSDGSFINSYTQGFAAELDEHSDVLELNPQLSPGFTANAGRIDRGERDLAFTWQFNLYNAYRDQGSFAEGNDLGPTENELNSTLPAVHKSQTALVTYADNDGIETVHDLEGRQVGLDVQGGGNTLQLLDMFELAGIDAQFNFHSFSERNEALLGRRVDAQSVIVTNDTSVPGTLVPAWEELELKFVEIPDDLQQQLVDNNPVVEWGSIVGSELENVNTPREMGEGAALTLGSAVGVLADKDPDLVYEFVSTVLDNQDDLADYHATLADFGIGEDRLNFDGVPDGTPFHEGAIRYFEEENIDYPEQP